MDRNRKNINFVNDNFTNSYPVIDGAVIGLDTDYLYYSRMIYAYGNLSTSEGYRFNIIPLIYKAIVNGGINNINDFMKYYAQYNNETGLFTLNIAALEKLSDSTSQMDLEYLKSVCFTNITDINQVFDAAIHGNYSQDITQVIVGYVSSADDYNRLTTASAFGSWFNTDKDVRTLSNGLRIIFTDKLVINSDVSWNPKSMGYNTITIVGNGSTINGNAGDRYEKKWLVMDDDVTFIVNDLTIKDFNTAVECLQGTCYFNNIKFDGNRMDYYIDRDWGAAILNTGIVICNNCTFTNNYAKYGGAIFNQGFLALNNCTFSGNTAYGKEGDNVCVGDGGHVCVDGVNVTATKGAVYFAESLSKSSATWASIACIAGSFAIGFLAGVITANPIAGIAIGAAVGAALGTVTASQIISSNFDIHYDRLSTCLFVIGGSTLAGAVGGFAGYLAVTASFAPAAEAGEGIPYSYGEFDEVSVESEPVIRTLFGK